MGSCSAQVQGHASRGPMVYFRVYSGIMKAKMPLLNATQQERERTSKLVQVRRRVYVNGLVADGRK